MTETKSQQTNRFWGNPGFDAAVGHRRVPRGAAATRRRSHAQRNARLLNDSDRRRVGTASAGATDGIAGLQAKLVGSGRRDHRRFRQHNRLHHGASAPQLVRPVQRQLHPRSAGKSSHRLLVVCRDIRDRRRHRGRHRRAASTSESPWGDLWAEGCQMGTYSSGPDSKGPRQLWQRPSLPREPPECTSTTSNANHGPTRFFDSFPGDPATTFLKRAAATALPGHRAIRPKRRSPPCPCSMSTSPKTP